VNEFENLSRLRRTTVAVVPGRLIVVVLICGGRVKVTGGWMLMLVIVTGGNVRVEVI
jgi:hypothetical protein